MHCNGQSFLRKIVKIVATRCHLLRLKCTIFDFGEECEWMERERRGEEEVCSRNFRLCVKSVYTYVALSVQN